MIDWRVTLPVFRFENQFSLAFSHPLVIRDDGNWVRRMELDNLWSNDTYELRKFGSFR